MIEHDSCEGCKYGQQKYDELPCNHCIGTVSPTSEFYKMCTDFYEPKKSDNPYWERICKLSDKQRAKGMETYGQGLENNPMGIVDRLTYFEEELVDALMYCEWIKDKLAELEGEKT